MTSKQQSMFDIHNIGPHKDFRALHKPGVNVWRGRNGAGKSTGIAAIATALGGHEFVSVRDGALAGSVSHDGVVVFHVGKRLSKSGAPSVEIGNYGALSAIIDGEGRKDPKLADAERIKALLSMVPIEVTDQVIDILTVGNPKLCEGGALNVLEAAEKVRRTANAQALVSKKEADAARGVADAESTRLGSLGAPPACKLTVVEAQALEDLSAKAHAKTEVLAKQRAEAEERHARIAATMGERPSMAAADAALEAATADVEKSEQESTAAILAVAAANAVLAQAREAVDRARVARSHAEFACRKARADDLQWEKHALALSEPISGPVAADVAAAAEALASARATTEAARVHASIKTCQETIGDALVTFEAARIRESTLRELAQSVSERLGKILDSAGAEGLTVEDDRLFYTLDGKRMLFADRLSFGQRVKVALTVALLSFKGRMVPLAPSFWAGLQPKFQKEIARMAFDMNVMLVTEMPSDDDEITIEWVQ